LPSRTNRDKCSRIFVFSASTRLFSSLVVGVAAHLSDAGSSGGSAPIARPLERLVSPTQSPVTTPCTPGVAVCVGGRGDKPHPPWNMSLTSIVADQLPRSSSSPTIANKQTDPNLCAKKDRKAPRLSDDLTGDSPAPALPSGCNHTEGADVPTEAARNRPSTTQSAWPRPAGGARPIAKPIAQFAHYRQ
jgi:hypothetical protein